eukprot:5158467-Pyramimonas_sp.AAC.1
MTKALFGRAWGGELRFRLSAASNNYGPHWRLFGTTGHGRASPPQDGPKMALGRARILAKYIGTSHAFVVVLLQTTQAD